MNCYVGIIEHNHLAVDDAREVAAVHLDGASVLKIDMPVLPFHIDDIDIVTLFVEERVQTLCRTHRHIVF